MADPLKAINHILGWEGGWADDPQDKGGKTNMGVTLATWQAFGYDKNFDGHIDAEDLKLITRNDVFEKVFIPMCWLNWKAERIPNQSVAEILTDWVWGSGSWGIIIPQKLLNVAADGKVGPMTLETLLSQDQQEFHKKVWYARHNFLKNIVRQDKTQQKFFKGWINRLNTFTYQD